MYTRNASDKDIENTVVPTVSVIVPVYNVQSYLPFCIESILKQSFTDIEVLLVDDGSTDESAKLCDAWAERDSRVQVIHKDNGGLSSARNAGLEVARGRYIAFVDADDTIHPQMFEILYEAIKETDTKLAICNFVQTTEPIVQWPELQKRHPTKTVTRDDIFRSITVEYVVAWNKLYHQSLFKDIRYPIGRYHEDEFVAHQIFWLTDTVAFVDVPLYGYLQRAGSITACQMNERYIDALDAFRGRIDFCIQKSKLSYAIFSIDSLLGLYEHFLKEMSPKARQEKVLADEMLKDYKQYAGYMLAVQKKYWKWLRKNPVTYRHKREKYEKRILNIKRWYKKFVQ